MTTNQLQFQRNAIEQAYREADVAERQRSNRAQESLRARELGVKAEELDQKEREALAKYGTVKYLQKGAGSEEKELHAMENVPSDALEKWMDPFLNIFRAFTGGKK